MAKTRPRHCLEKVCAEWSRNAGGVNDSCWTSRVEVIQVHASPHDLNKFGKRVATHGESRFIRCQVAGDDVRGAWRYCTKVSAATKVGRRIDYRRLAKIWVLAWQKLSEGRAGAVALIAGHVRVDDVAAQSDERPIFPFEVQRDGRYLKSSMNSGIVAFFIIIASSLYPQGTAQHSRKDDCNKGCDTCRGFSKSSGCHCSCPFR